MDWEIGPLKPDCSVRKFGCGVAEIDRWFHRKSIKRHSAFLVRTFTAHHPGNPVPSGFYSLTLGSEEWSHLPKRDRGASDGKDFPTVTIHYFAVHRSLQNQGLGRLLMAHALEQACEVARIAGTYAVKLIAEDAGVESFYQKLGFRTYGEQNGRAMMLIPIGSLLDAAED